MGFLLPERRQRQSCTLGNFPGSKNIDLKVCQKSSNKVILFVCCVCYFHNLISVLWFVR